MTKIFPVMSRLDKNEELLTANCQTESCGFWDTENDCCAVSNISARLVEVNNVLERMEDNMS